MHTETDGGEAASAPEPPSPSAPTRFVLDRDFGARAEAINDFYNRNTGRSRSLEAYRWEWLDGIPEPGIMWTISDAATGRLVATHGYVRTPLVARGKDIAAGRTENTIVEVSTRKKLFYPAMERRARAEVLKHMSVLYTVHTADPMRRIRIRLGYQSVGWWVVYLPKIGAGYLQELLQRGRDALAPKISDVLLRISARTIAGLSRGATTSISPHVKLEIHPVRDIIDLGEEYERFWHHARQGYDVTIDRSFTFLRWRFTNNPHLRYRTWVMRSGGQLCAVVIGHLHVLGRSSALYVDDIIVGRYEEADFKAVLACLPMLEPAAEAIVLMTLAVDTPLYRVLRRAFPLQSRLLDRFGKRLFNEMFAYDRDGVNGIPPWYVTPIFSEGMDTSRPASASHSAA